MGPVWGGGCTGCAVGLSCCFFAPAFWLVESSEYQRPRSEGEYHAMKMRASAGHPRACITPDSHCQQVLKTLSPLLLDHLP